MHGVYPQPATLAAQQGDQVYDTALSLNAQGANAKLDAPIWELFTRNSTLTYQNVTVTTSLSSGTTVSNAPPGTYRIAGGSSEANIIWDDSNQPVRTCLVCPFPAVSSMFVLFVQLLAFVWFPAAASSATPAHQDNVHIVFGNARLHFALSARHTVHVMTIALTLQVKFEKKHKHWKARAKNAMYCHVHHGHPIICKRHYLPLQKIFELCKVLEMHRTAASGT